MNRRDLIKNIALISGGIFIGSNYLLTSCKSSEAGSLLLSTEHQALLTEIAETIIPETDTPGAKSAEVTKFISGVFSDIYSEEEQTAFLKAIDLVATKSKELMRDDFVKLSADKKAEVFNKVKNPKDKGFLAMYQIVLFSYLTSEKGTKATFRYLPVPGKQIGDYPYKKGDKMFVGLAH